MRAVVQRVSQASVSVDQQVIGQIERGLMILLGVGQGDCEQDATWLAEKCATLRIFEDDDGKMNRSVVDIAGAALVVSQFTLFGDCRKGRRPSFISAADPDTGNRLYETFCQQLRNQNVPVETGRFQAQMDVALNNDGPVTILLDSQKQF